MNTVMNFFWECIECVLSGVMPWIGGEILNRINRGKRIQPREYNYNLSNNIIALEMVVLVLSVITSIFLMLLQNSDVAVKLAIWLLGNIICISFVRKMAIVFELGNKFIEIALWILFNLYVIYMFWDVDATLICRRVIFGITVLFIVALNLLAIDKQKVREIEYVIYCKEGAVIKKHEEPKIQDGFLCIWSDGENEKKRIKINEEQVIKIEENINDLPKKKQESSASQKYFILKIVDMLMKYTWDIINVMIVIAMLVIYPLAVRDIMAENMHLQIFVPGVVIIMGFALYKLQRRKTISVMNYIAIIASEGIYLWTSDGIPYSTKALYMFMVMFAIIILVALGLTWCIFKARQKFPWMFAVCLIMIWVTYASFYSTIDSMYSTRGMGCFKLDQGMPYEQMLLAEDYLYYSGDMLLGTELSDVKIDYIDFLNFKENDPRSLYCEQADRMIKIAKVASLSETLVFVVYIGIIIIQSGEWHKDKHDLQVKLL